MRCSGVEGSPVSPVESHFLGVGGMGHTRAVLETLSGPAGEDVGWRATHRGFMLRRWMGPCLTGSANPGTRRFPPVLLFPLVQWRGKGRCSLGDWGPPCTPQSRQRHWCPFLRAPALAFESSSGSWSVRCCWGCARDAAVQPGASGWLRSLPEIPSAPAGTVPKAGGSGRAAGWRGPLLPSIPVRAPVGAALKPTAIDFPTPVGGSMSSRFLIDGALGADVATRGVCSVPGGACNLFLS